MLPTRPLAQLHCFDSGPTVRGRELTVAGKVKLNLRQNLTVGDSPTLHLVGNVSGSRAKVTLKDSGQLVAVFDRVRWGKEGLKNKLTVGYL